MAGLTEKVVAELQQIFPERKKEDLLGIASDPSLHYGTITEQLLLQRAIEHILDSRATLSEPQPEAQPTSPHPECSRIMDNCPSAWSSLSPTPSNSEKKTPVKLKDRCYGPYFGSRTSTSPFSRSRSPTPDSEDNTISTDALHEPLPPRKSKGKSVKGPSSNSPSSEECDVVDKRIPNFSLLDETLDDGGNSDNRGDSFDLQADVDKALSFFPDADPEWLEQTIHDAKLNEPTSYLDVVINSMFDATYAVSDTQDFQLKIATLDKKLQADSHVSSEKLCGWVGMNLMTGEKSRTECSSSDSSSAAQTCSKIVQVSGNSAQVNQQSALWKTGGVLMQKSASSTGNLQKQSSDVTQWANGVATQKKSSDNAFTMSSASSTNLDLISDNSILNISSDDSLVVEDLSKSPSHDVWLNRQFQIEKRLSDSLIILDSSPEKKASCTGGDRPAASDSCDRDKEKSRKRITDQQNDDASPVKQRKQVSVVSIADDNDNSLDFMDTTVNHRFVTGVVSSSNNILPLSFATDNGNASPPGFADDAIILDDSINTEAEVPLLPCDKCENPHQTLDLAQCSDGHVLCRVCIEKLAKQVLSTADEVDLACPVKDCKLAVPFGEAERVLPHLVLELLKERSERASVMKIAAMEGMVQCPGCQSVVEMMPGDKEFCCGNEDCMVSCCRYCKQDWNGSDHASCSPLLNTVLISASGKAGSLPLNWAPFPEHFSEDYYKVELDNNCEESQYVYHLFGKTMKAHATIHAVYRIQNIRLWQKFALARQHMIEDFGEQKLNERLLFHGTNSQHIDSICKEGFDWRLSGVNGTVYGQGCYFAANASYSNKYCISHGTPPAKWLPAASGGNSRAPTSKDPHQSVDVSSAANTQGFNFSANTSAFSFGIGPTPGQFGGVPASLSTLLQAYNSKMANMFPFGGQVISHKNQKKHRAHENVKLMLVARVLCGRTVLGEPHLRRPPTDTSDPKHRPFNSTCDNDKTPGIFVVYDSAQAYPEYVVAYV